MVYLGIPNKKNHISTSELVYSTNLKLVTKKKFTDPPLKLVYGTNLIFQVTGKKRETTTGGGSVYGPLTPPPDQKYAI